MEAWMAKPLVFDKLNIREAVGLCLRREGHAVNLRDRVSICIGKSVLTAQGSENLTRPF